MNEKSSISVNDNMTPLFWPDMELGDFILTILALFVIVSWVLAILFILWGCVLLILSWWKDDKIKPAINTIRYALIWVIITVVSIFVFPILGSLLWLDVKRFAEPTRILKKIWEIGNNIFWTTDASKKQTETDAGSDSDTMDDSEFGSDFTDL